MNAKDFIKKYNSFYGDKVENLKQITLMNVTGDELFDFVKYIEQQASGVFTGSGQSNIPDVSVRSSPELPNFKAAFNELACCVKFGMTVENTKQQLSDILDKFGINDQNAH